jgi:hypothetical protein
MRKRAVILRFANSDPPLALKLRFTRYAGISGASNRAFRAFRITRSLPVDEAALILARFYMSPPADPGGPALKRDGVGTR